MDLLLQGIYRHSGYDFSDYLFSTLRRRIWHRVQAEGLQTISGLLEKALHDPGCLKRLLAAFTIQVTEMFRDPSFFKAFREQVVPWLKEQPFIRIWHVGCSSGEEVYAMALLLQEEGIYHKSILYATDIHEGALRKAKAGHFPLAKMKDYTANYQQAGGKQAFSEYYAVRGDRVLFDPALQKNMVFAQHNLVTDGSFNEFHVILCRNVMIYFNDQLRDRVHRLLYQSLVPAGFLGLGKKEGIKFSVHGADYQEINQKEKIYRKRACKGEKM